MSSRVVTPKEDKNIEKHSMGSKILKHPYSAYLDIEAVQPKHDTYSNDPTKYILK